MPRESGKMEWYMVRQSQTRPLEMYAGVYPLHPEDDPYSPFWISSQKLWQIAHWDRLVFKHEYQNMDELQYPEDDHDPYWDVLGDGWIPGHTMTEAELALDLRSLSCFRNGWVDYKRGIYWKYFNNRQHTSTPEYDRKAVGERLMKLAVGELITMEEVEYV